MTVSLRPYRAEDDDVVRVMDAMTRDDWEDARTAWNSTG
jgi:hypothetical protein